MKKTYQKPAMEVAADVRTDIICTSGDILSIVGGGDIGIGGGGSGPARAPMRLGSDDDIDWSQWGFGDR